MEQTRRLNAMDINQVPRMQVKKKGVTIGNVTISLKNFRRLILIGESVILFTTGFAAGRVTSNKQNVEAPYINVQMNSSFVPTYDGIPYYVGSYGSTLDGIIYGYVEDANEMYKAKKEIMRLNGMRNEYLQYGETILLCNVPEDKLEDYGYSVNYNFFDASYEFEDRLAFLDKISESITTDPDLLNEIDALHNMYRQYGYNMIDSEESSEALDILLNEIRDVCEDVEQDYGYSFDNNKVARPLNEATRNLEYVKGMGL